MESHLRQHRRHIWVSGKVQGVWFRQSTKEQAVLLGVSGWVRNLSDGRVEAVFEGTEPAVDAMVAWARRGPRSATVRAIEVTTEPPQGLAGFEVTG